MKREAALTNARVVLADREIDGTVVLSDGRISRVEEGRSRLPTAHDMEGDYLGYDGPCPPWNDSIIHHYHFVLYATDLERCPVEGAFTGSEVEAALAGHVLAEARVVGTYALNPALLG